MLILTLRTDRPESEIGLFKDDDQLVYEKWPAHRQLAETLHVKLRDLLAGQGKDWADIEGIVVYQGPGSFTGLRIGLSFANALAASLEIPIVGFGDPTWLDQGLKALGQDKNHKQVLPEYGGEIFASKP